MKYRDHPKLFQALKWTQLLFSFMVFILEMVELGSGLNYIISGSSTNAPIKTLFLNSDLGSKAVKKYVYFVFSLSILSIGMYLARYRGSWTSRYGPFVWFEIVMLILWSSSSIANLYDMFHGAADLCHTYRITYSLQQITKEPVTLCDTYIASLVFCFLTTLTFILSLFIALQVRSEKRKSKVEHFQKIKVIKYINHESINPDDNNSDGKSPESKSPTGKSPEGKNSEAIFLRIERHDSFDGKIIAFKGRVEKIKENNVDEIKKMGEKYLRDLEKDDYFSNEE